jgi:hypothetical protein
MSSENDGGGYQDGSEGGETLGGGEGGQYQGGNVGGETLGGGAGDQYQGGSAGGEYPGGDDGQYHQVGQPPQYGDPGAQPQYGDPGAQPAYGGDLGSGPTAQFDAFRARMSDDREQQEAQGLAQGGSYTFPPEYAADPNAMFPPAEQTATQFGVPYGAGSGAGAGSGPVGGARSGAGLKWRSVAIFGGAVLVACALGVGAWAAFGSSSPSSSNTASGATAGATPAATGTGADKHTKAATFRVKIQNVGADSFTGTVAATGETVTVALTEKTHYGTKAHPFSQGDLTTGETVVVHGRRTGTATVTATTVAADTPAASSGATAGGSGTGAGTGTGTATGSAA